MRSTEARPLALVEANAAASVDAAHILCSEDGDVWMLDQPVGESDEAFRQRVEGLALVAASHRHSDVLPAFTSAPWLTKPTPTHQRVADATERNTDA